MLNLFKRKESDIHEQKNGFSIREVDEDELDEELEDDEDSIGVLIHFTPVATYLYINRGDFNYSTDSNGFYEFRDMDGNPIDVSGTCISTRIEGYDQLHALIDKYKLNHPTIPIVEIEVEEF